MNKTLYQRLLEAGYPQDEMAHHESDLYVEVTPVTTKVIDEWCKENKYSRMLMCPIFRDNVAGKKMYDCAFQYDPYWEDKENVK